MPLADSVRGNIEAANFSEISVSISSIKIQSVLHIFADKFLTPAILQKRSFLTL